MGRKKEGVNAQFSPQLAEKIEIKKIEWLKPYAKNARTHSETQLDEIAASIAEFGFTTPILAKADGTIIAGHGRVEASTKRLGLTEVPVIVLDHLTDKQARALVIADNKIAENAGWDMEVLADELNALAIDGFDLSLTGFDSVELEDILPRDLEEEPEEPTEEEGDVEPPAIATTAIGDVWILGNHRLVCGDSTNLSVLAALMGDEKADLLHTDPPYNVDYDAESRPKPGKAKRKKIENDKMSDKEFLGFLESAFKNAFGFMADNAAAYIWHSDQETENFKAAAKKAGLVFSQTIIWVKPMLLSRTDYQWAHEPCLYLKKGRPYMTPDRTKTTVWDFGGYNKSANVHPTQKPTFIPEEAINNSSRKKDIVLDVFGGSGSTLLACEKLGRRGRVVELDPAYCDVIVERWQKATRKKATLQSTNKTYGDMRKARNG